LLKKGYLQKSSFLLIIVLCSATLFATPVPRGQTPFEDENGFVDDIIYTSEQLELLFGDGEAVEGQTGRVQLRYRWPKNAEGRVIVPYQFRTTDLYCKLENVFFSVNRNYFLSIFNQLKLTELWSLNHFGISKQELV
jgi:hypothetical protein